MTEIREVPIVDSNVSAPAKPAVERDDVRRDASPAVPSTDLKPATQAASTAPAAEPQGHGPHDNYGIEEPTSAKPDDWLEYDEKLLKAKDAYDAAQKKTDTPAPAVAAKPDEKPAEAKPDEGAAPVYEPPAPRSTATLSPDDTFELEPGFQWTRAQIRDEILTTRARAAEADAYNNLFGHPNAESAAKAWKPFLEELRANPDLSSYLTSARDEYFERQADPEYAAYVDENRQRYLAWRKENPLAGGGARPQSQPQQTFTREEVAAEAARIVQTQQQQRDAERANFEQFRQSVANERVALWKAYPVLEQNPELWQAIKDHAIVSAQAERQRTGRSATYTLTDAVRDRWPLVKMYLDRGGAVAVADQTPAPVRSRGAESTRVNTADDDAVGERQFASAEEAAADWLRRYPNGFTG